MFITIVYICKKSLIYNPYLLLNNPYLNLIQLNTVNISY